MDISIGRFTGRCAESGDPFRAGEPFYSLLVAEGAEIVRKDFRAAAWQGAPDDAICWWKATMPDVHAGKVQWAPNDAILGFFNELYENDELADQRYVLALLLVRKRIARLEELERDQNGREVMLLYCPSAEREFHVPVVEPAPERIELIQNELARLLFSAVH